MSTRSPVDENGEGIVFEAESATSWRSTSEALRLKAGAGSLDEEASLLETELESARVSDDPAERARLASLAYALAAARFAAGDATEGDLTLERVRSLDPGFEPAWGAAFEKAVQAGRWGDVSSILVRALERAALAPRDKGELLVNAGFIHEHHLGDGTGALHAYRRAAREVPGEPAVGLSLFLFGLRRGDHRPMAEGLDILLRAATEPEARVALLCAWAEAERRLRGEDVTALERVRAALAEACPSIPEGVARHPLFAAMTSLFGAAPTPAERRAVMETLLGIVPDAPPKAALLRAHARVLRDEIRDPRGALACLRRALALEPRRSSLWGELVGLAFELRQPEVVVSAWTQVASAGELIAVGEAARDFALSVGVALARGGRWAETSAFLLEHAELSAEDADVFALLAAVSARAGRPEDFATLARLWEDQATRLARRESDPAAQRTAADMLVVAGTVQRRLGSQERAERLLRRACGMVPGHRPALEALLDLQRRERRWLQLADTWEEELERLLAQPDPTAERDLRVQKGLEELMAVCRDELGDLRWAERVAERGVERVGGPRALVRRVGVVVAAGVAGQGQGPSGALWASLADHAGDEKVAARLRLYAAETFVREGDRESARELAERAHATAGVGPTSACAVALLERLAPSDERRLAALEAELATLVAAEAPAAELRTARFRLSWSALAAGGVDQSLAALAPLREHGDALAWAWTWDVVRRLGKPALAAAMLAEEGRTTGSVPPRAMRAEAPADRGEAWERAGRAELAKTAFTTALGEGFDVDAILGLHRLAARADHLDEAVETLRALAAGLGGDTREALSREAELLAASGGLTPDAVRTADVLEGTDPRWEEERALLGWLQGVRRRDHRGTAEGLLGLAVLAAGAEDEGALASRESVSGLLLRAAARARVAGPAHAAAVLARAWDYEPAEAVLAPGLSDLPLREATWGDAGVLARQRRADTAPSDLAVSLLMEAAQACDRTGDVAGALALWGKVLARAPETLDALWAVRRWARESGDRAAVARVTVRLAAVVRNRARATTLWIEAGQAWEDAGRVDDAIACYWQAVARVGANDELAALLPPLLEGRDDILGLEVWLGHRLQRAVGGEAQIALLWERGVLRRDRMGNGRDAVTDFKRILKLDSSYRPALEALAAFAEDAGDWAAAAHVWERILAIASSLGQPTLPISLSLAAALAGAGDVEGARGVLEEACLLAPEEEAPREQLVALSRSTGDWEAAEEGLADLADRASSPARKAAFAVEMGAILEARGQASDAAAAYSRAGELDPLGEGWERALALAEARSDRVLRNEVLTRALAGLRSAVDANPLEPALLQRLAGWLERVARGTVGEARAKAAEGAAVAHQLLAALGHEGLRPAMPIGAGRGLATPGFWARLAAPGARGFALEIWPSLVDAVAELHRDHAPQLPEGKRRRIPPQSEPSLAWIEGWAVALGLPTLPLVAIGASSPRIFAVELPEPALCFSMDAPPRLDSPRDRFAVGRALGLLHDRATVLETLPTPTLLGVFGAAAFVAGTRPTVVAPGAFKNLEQEAKRLGKAMGRKERRTLELEASRFGFEPMDAEAFQQGLLITADRLGLLLAGDLGAALVARMGAELPSNPALLARRPALLSLVKFALSEEHIQLRHDAGLAGDAA